MPKSPRHSSHAKYAWLALASVIVIVVEVSLLLDMYIRPSTADERSGIAQSMLGIIGGSILAIGLVFTWMTVRISQEGHITQRFNDAIDHLGQTHPDGSPAMVARLGGIYALERIARDSERDHWPIMEVLCAYVRSHGANTLPMNPKSPHPARGIGSSYVNRAIKRGLSRQAGQLASREDVEAIITVLRRRHHIAYEIEHGYRINLSKSNLESLDLSAVDLRNAILHDANLAKANLQHATVAGADLRRANLSGIEASPADFSGALMHHANLCGANLLSSNMEGAILADIQRDRRTLLPSISDASATERELG